MNIKQTLDDIKELFLILSGMIIVLQLCFSKSPYLLEIFSRVLMNEMIECLGFALNFSPRRNNWGDRRNRNVKC